MVDEELPLSEPRLAQKVYDNLLSEPEQAQKVLAENYKHWQRIDHCPAMSPMQSQQAIDHVMEDEVWNKVEHVLHELGPRHPGCELGPA